MIALSYKVLPEQTIYIDLPDTDELKIKTILRGSLDQPLVILIHGRPGSGNDLLEFLGARYLGEQGYATLRLFLYDEAPNTRNMFDCTLDTHVTDLDTVIRYVRGQGAKQVFATGHSYGGPTILKAKEKLDGAALWDPSHGSVWVENAQEIADMFPQIEVGDYIIGLAGTGYMFPKRMYDDETHWGDTTDWAQFKGYPLKIIGAAEGMLGEYGQRYIDAADEPKEYMQIKGAGHLFDESDEIMLELFEQTAKWFNRFKR